MQDNSYPEIKIPDKLYFKIGEVGKITGLPSSVIRFWETEFSKINPKRTPAGQRHYKRSDVELILKIKHLLYDKKFTIQGAINHLGSDKSENKSSLKTLDSVTDVVKELRKELIEIRNILS
ncbi:MAG: MerR family transcriptional regulator [Proteobacteria bacterium]|nr:MerR family transcriptional regulator [Pseudomonadota bacterium]